jgi:hypothetical protein
MSARERRERDPLRLQQILARLARIKVARAVRETQELRERWDRMNIVEEAYLRRRLAGANEGQERQDG